MQLYTLGMSPNALRVRAVVYELALDVEMVEVNFRDLEARVATLEPYNPNIKVPVLVDGDFVLWESRAIVAYLASLNPASGLYPENLKRRAIVDQWSYWHAVHLGPAMQRIAMERFLKEKFGIGEPDERALESGLKESAQFLNVLDGNLAGKEWVAGELSIADFTIASTFLYRTVTDLSLEAFPNVAAWIARVDARPSWQKATAPVTAFIGG
jgi:glutathione S-transferase